jgi:CubicO group peptidase (beta-lactamase class C family)
MSASQNGAALTAEGIQRLHEVAQRSVDGGQVPGLVALVARAEQVHTDALGTMAVSGPPVARDSIFRVSSDTKPITAAVTLALAAEGLLDIDEPVDRLLPELAGRRVLRRMDGPLGDTVPANRAVTTRDLLTFTFGFGLAVEMFTSPEPWPVVAAANELKLGTPMPADAGAQPDPDTWIARFGTLPLLAQPGERWFYNTSASVLGVLAARAAGQPFGDVLRTRLFEPLGMWDTAFWTPHTDRLMTAYRLAPDGSGALTAWDPPDGSWSRPPAFEDGAAGLVSTAGDLLAFSRMLLRGGAPVLPAESVRAMTTDQLTPEQKARGGLGPDFFKGRSWGFGQAVLDSGAYGWAGGFGSTWLMDPNEDLTVIVLTQRMFESGEPPALHTDYQAAAYAALA